MLYFTFFFLCVFSVLGSLDAARYPKESVLDLIQRIKEKKEAQKPVHKLMVYHPEYINSETRGKITRFPGMFSVFNTVVGCLDLFDTNIYQAIVVDFEDKGIYYEPGHGSNWWTYYCDPICIDSPVGKYKIQMTDARMCWKMGFHTEFALTKERVSELISRYIKFKPTVILLVDQFEEEHFKDLFIIGLHYRGTDKVGAEGNSEARFVPYQTVKETVQDYISASNLLDYRIFIASDEEAFIAYFSAEFPGKVIFTGAERSSNNLALHHHTTNPYRQGLESMVDCHLLSRTSVLFRTSSNLSLWSTYLNPDLQCFNLSDRYEVNLNW